MANEQKMINIGGLWVNKNSKGEIYLAGYLNGARLLVFKNNYKESDKHPDYVMYVAPNQQRQNASSGEFEKQASGEPSGNSGELPDDVPF